MIFAVKRPLAFDPNEYDYGPATAAIRSIVVEWAAVDWFEPSGVTDAELIQIFEEHTALAHRAAPQLFGARVNVRVVAGGWSEFGAWCKRVREQTTWDWKFSVLKNSHDHSTANGWSLETHAPQVPLGVPKAGDLFVRFNPTALVWNAFLPAPDLGNLGRASDSAQFYFGHAQSDAFTAIEWQLAEKSVDAGSNPFVPLVRCYRAGGYPFSLGRDTVVLFRFTADEGALPRATLLKR